MESIDMKDQQDIQAPHLKRHFGNTLPLGIKQNGQPRYLLGPHWYVFIIAFIISIGLTYFLLSEVTKILTLPWKIVLWCTSIGFILSYLNIGFSVPGIAYGTSQLDDFSQQSDRYCRPCRVLRPPKTIHCLDCDICIIGHDHHCPWIGKCVGRDNLSDFYLFLVMTFGNLTMMLVATVFGHE